MLSEFGFEDCCFVLFQVPEASTAPGSPGNAHVRTVLAALRAPIPTGAGWDSYVCVAKPDVLPLVDFEETNMRNSSNATGPIAMLPYSWRAGGRAGDAGGQARGWPVGWVEM